MMREEDITGLMEGQLLLLKGDFQTNTGTTVDIGKVTADLDLNQVTSNPIKPTITVHLGTMNLAGMHLVGHIMFHTDILEILSHSNGTRQVYSKPIRARRVWVPKEVANPQGPNSQWVPKV